MKLQLIAQSSYQNENFANTREKLLKPDIELSPCCLSYMECKACLKYFVQNCSKKDLHNHFNILGEPFLLQLVAVRF